MERLVLDTSVWIDLEREKLDFTSAIGRDKKLILPAIVAGGLKQALYAASKTEQRRQKALDFLARVESLTDFAPMDQRVADRYAELKQYSQEAGKPRGIADLLVAATAIEHKAALYSMDKRADFGSLPNLRLHS